VRTRPSFEWNESTTLLTLVSTHKGPPQETATYCIARSMLILSLADVSTQPINSRVGSSAQSGIVSIQEPRGSSDASTDRPFSSHSFWMASWGTHPGVDDSKSHCLHQQDMDKREKTTVSCPTSSTLTLLAINRHGMGSPLSSDVLLSTSRFHVRTFYSTAGVGKL
jgi:hypothetical protein